MADSNPTLDTDNTAPESGDTVEKVTSSAMPVESAEIAGEGFVQTLTRSIQDGNPDLLRDWIQAFFDSRAFWIDLGLIAFSLGLAFGISRVILRAFREGKLTPITNLQQRMRANARFNAFRLTLVPVMWVTLLVANSLGFACPLLRIWSLLISAFAILQLPSRFRGWKSWMHLVTTSAFTIVALHILGLLDDTSAFLDRLSVNLGSISLTALDVVKGVISLVLLFTLASFASRTMARRIGKLEDVDANVRVLAVKAMRVGFYTVAILMTMSIMGVPITALAVFGGALGLGLGFGLQKVVSNLVSGIILLIDKSIKPGDVIEIGGTYGWINSLNLRYVSVITRDNKEHLIPNEDLITNPVINWSFSSKLVRIRAPFGISYQSDIRLAMKLAEEAVKVEPRIVSKPPPRCNLIQFGDSSVDLELRFWIEDPTNGVGAVRSKVLLAMWDSFAENGIEFPFPQRDVNLRIEDPDLIERLLDAKSKD